MIYLLSNWILFLPLACGLAVVLAMSGSTLDRPRNDWLRITLRILIWQLVALAFVGIVFRLTGPHILWIFVVLAFLVQVLFWEYGLARNTLMIVVLATGGVPRRLERVTRYLLTEGRGYWKRLGARLQHSLRRSGDWMVAIERTRLVRDAPALQGLGIFRRYGKSEFLLTELAAGLRQRELISQMLGRLAASSFSLVLLLLLVFSVPATGLPSFAAAMLGTIDAINRDMGMKNPYFFDLWQGFSSSWLGIGFPLGVWSVIAALVMMKLFPRLTRTLPLARLFHGYYRALSLRGLAQIVTVEPQLSNACRAAAEASPVPLWSQRLARAAGRIDAGESAESALQRSRILKPAEASALALANNHESLSWTLNEIAESSMNRVFNRASVVAQLAVVGLVLCSAVVVFMISFGVMSVLVMWISALT